MFPKFHLIFLFLGLLLALVKGQGNMCGTPAPDPMKHCISLRLPWQPEPLYFCMEKEKFRYRNQCHSSIHCGMDMMRSDTLILATPWDCCPWTSIPDRCMTNNCPPPPLNRKCVVVDNPRYTWEGSCCPSYFCEEGMTPESCQGKRLDPTCVNPPQGKMNCVGFHDAYGCCTKFQCDGEGKPGLCPMQHRALQYQMQFNSSMAHMMNMTMGGAGGGAGSGAGGAAPPPPAAREVEDDFDPSSPSSRSLLARNMVTFMTSMDCVGDSNCPGNMKCCSSDISVYGGGGGPYMMRNMNPTHGYCQDPVMMMAINSPPPPAYF